MAKTIASGDTVTLKDGREGTVIAVLLSVISGKANEYLIQFKKKSKLPEFITGTVGKFNPRDVVKLNNEPY